MFRVRPESDRTLRMATIAVLALSISAMAVTIWVMVEFIAEQQTVQELIGELPAKSKEKAKVLAGDLKWQFRLSMLIVLNLIVTAVALVILSQAYRSSQESLRDIKALATDILSSMDLAVLTTDKNGIITSINRRGLVMLRQTERCIGQAIENLDLSYPLEQFRLERMKNRGPSSPKDFTDLTYHPPRTFRAFVQPLQNYNGSEVGSILQLRDVTERTLIDERLRKMERYMGLGSLAAGLHHEIKNPLAALSLHVQLLEEQLGEILADSEVGQMFSVIKSEVNRVGNVLEGFRDFASVDQLNAWEFNLANVISQQVELISPRAKQQEVTISQERVDPEIRITGDPVRLEQVLLNLLVNALDAMPNGGNITIRTAESENSISILVSDTGCGVPPELHGRILDPYFTTKSHGTGLGLALCEKIIRQHAGTLDFQTSDLGTIFEIKLPTVETTGDIDG